MTMLHTVKNYIERHRMVPPHAKVLCGFSGGADSTALLHLLQCLKNELSCSVAAAHINHGIRGEEASRDETFCRTFCAAQGIGYFHSCVDVPTYAKTKHMGIEEAARELRYGTLSALAKEHGFTHIATAHNSNDNAETILFNLARGTAIEGLCGIPPVRGNIIRPLLCVSREKILAYIRENGLDYVLDSSNDDCNFTRNRIRHEILPVLHTINPAYLDNISTTARLLREDADYLSKEAQQYGSLSVPDLRSLPFPMLSRRIITLYREAGGDPGQLTSRHIEKIINLLKETEGRSELSLPSGIVALREYRNFYMNKAPVFDLSTKEIRLEPGTTTNIPFAEFRIRCSTAECDNFHNSFTTFHINCDIINGYPVLRKPVPGERFRRNEGSGSKKLTRLFSDMKLPKEKRGSLCVLSDEDKKTLAVIGLGVNYDFIAKRGLKTYRFDVLY